MDRRHPKYSEGSLHTQQPAVSAKRCDHDNFKALSLKFVFALTTLKKVFSYSHLIQITNILLHSTIKLLKLNSAFQLLERTVGTEIADLDSSAEIESLLNNTPSRTADHETDNSSEKVS